MTGSWWRRNTAAVVALAVLVPATALAVGWREWHEVYDDPSQYTRDVLPDEDGTIEIDGAVLGPAKADTFTEADGFELPDGAKVVAVKITVDNADLDDPIRCWWPTLVEQSTGREWAQMSNELGLSSDPDVQTECDPSPTGPYDIIVPFIVPDDAEGPFWLDIDPDESDGAFARFPVTP